VLDDETSHCASISQDRDDAARAFTAQNRPANALQSDLLVDDEIPGVYAGVNLDQVSITRSVDSLLNRLKGGIVTANNQRFASCG
jgi:hypothetical protein